MYSHQKKPSSSKPRCLGIVRENGTDVVLFDASGKPRCFRYKGSPEHLCFSTHGTAGVDDLLTPCFDEDGLHGQPDEDCFCGIDTPHIHAHKHHDEKCKDEPAGGCKSSSKKKQSSSLDDVNFLASVTLHPTEEEQIPVPVTNSHPNECNSKGIAHHLHEHGYTTDDLGRRVTKIQHGDHTDNLIHNETTGDLYLEHDCNECGTGDLHGKFDLVSKRKLEGDLQLHFFKPASNPFSFADTLTKVFGVEGLSQVFDTESDRVKAIKPTIKRKKPCCDDPTCKANLVGKTGGDDDCCASSKSPPVQKKDCCASGSCDDKPVEKDDCCASGSCNKPVQKDDCCASGSCDKPAQKDDCCASGSCNKPVQKDDCCASGSCNKPVQKDDCCASGACDKPVQKDDCCASGSCDKPAEEEDCCASGACRTPADDCCASGECTRSSIHLRIPEPPEGNEVRSTFHCTGICCASEIPLINTVLEPKDGVANVLINVPVKQVMVDHDPSVISATELAKILNSGGFGATLKRDGASALNNTVGRSHFFVEKICCASEIPAINSILEPMQGVQKVSMNVTAKMVYVDHDTAVVSAQSLCNALNDDRFGAHIKHDAKEDMGPPLTAFVRSSFAFNESKDPDNDKITAYLGTFESDQVESFVVDLPKHEIYVVHNPLVLPADDLRDSINQYLQLDATVKEDGAANTKWEFPEVHEDEVEVHETGTYPRPHVIISGVFWVISMLSLIGGNWEHLKWTALVSCAFGLPPIAIKSYKTLKRCRFDTNVLMFSATVGAVALQEFTEAAAVAFLFSLSEWLEVRATVRARNALSEIVNLRPDKANLVHPSTKDIVVVPASAVPVGALVSVKTGDKIPCDGTVVSGISTVDESSLTGESRPVRKGIKDKVSGGTVNSGMVELMVRTTETAEGSAVSRLIRLVEEAQANRSETEKLVEEFAKYYTPLVILSALCMCTIPWAFGNETGRFWTNNGLVLLVVACPCALIISTPVTYVAGLAAAAQRGILVKGGAHLETLGMVKKIAFDKTGTLTQGNFALLHLKTFGDTLKREQTLEYLALIEARAHHPLAQAIMTGIQNEGVKISKTKSVKSPTNLAGEGVTATVDGATVHVGNKRLFNRLGLYDTLSDEMKEKTDKWVALGGTVGFMSIEGHGIVAAFSVADAVRPESLVVVSALQKMGIEVTMLTGDNNHAALVIGGQVGLDEDHIRGQLLPEDKLRIVETMKDNTINSGFGSSCRNRPRTMFCGDGVNDAPALAMADVGVAMGAGAALAMETSDCTLLDSNLEKLVYSLKLGKRVIQKIRENVIFSFVVKGVVVGFTLAGEVHLWAAIATDVGAMILVTLNGMTLLPYRKKNVELDELGKAPEGV